MIVEIFVVILADAVTLVWFCCVALLVVVCVMFCAAGFVAEVTRVVFCVIVVLISVEFILELLEVVLDVALLCVELVWRVELLVINVVRVGF